MRRNDLSGAKAWILDVWEIRSRIVWRFSGRKMSILLRLVIRRVLDGGVGWISGGKLERSRVRFMPLREEKDEDREVRELVAEGDPSFGLSIVKYFVCDRREFVRSR